jgi:hypothetical protein
MAHVNTAQITNFKEDLEERYVQACHILSATEKPNITAIAAQLKLPYYTVYKHFKGIAHP